ncbi:MAG: hypothetical protein AAFO83_00970 [Cyanobacteria bacterium J06607_13]
MHVGASIDEAWDARLSRNQIGTEQSTTTSAERLLEHLTLGSVQLDTLTQLLEQFALDRAEILEDEDVESTQDPRLDLHIGQPTAAQLNRINAMTGRTWDEGDWFVVPLRASDNLISHSYRVWSLDILQQMARTYRDAADSLLNHDWYDVEKTVGFVFESLLIRDDGAPDEILDAGGMGEVNRQIVDEQGYCWLYLNVAIKSDLVAVVKGVEEMRLNDISTGTLLNKPKMYCPECSREHGRKVSFFETYTDKEDNERYRCPHYLPTPWMLYYTSLFDEEIPFASYVELDGTNQSVEVSFVVDGNLPAAQVIREA